SVCNKEMVVAMGITGYRLDRVTAKRIFVECSDAERILHAELVSPGAIASHYDPRRREQLRALAENCGAAPHSQAAEPPLPGVFSTVFADWTSPFRRASTLSSLEAGFVASCLVEL